MQEEQKQHKILVVSGSRDANSSHSQFILEMLKDHLEWADQVFIGDAAGVDSIVKKHCFEKQIDIRQFIALWSVHHKAAGPMRNKTMIDEAMKLSKNVRVVAFPKDDSRGTTQCIEYAKQKGLNVIVYAL